MTSLDKKYTIIESNIEKNGHRGTLKTYVEEVEGKIVKREEFIPKEEIPAVQANNSLKENYQECQ